VVHAGACNTPRNAGKMEARIGERSSLSGRRKRATAKGLLAPAKHEGSLRRGVKSRGRAYGIRSRDDVRGQGGYAGIGEAEADLARFPIARSKRRVTVHTDLTSTTDRRSIAVEWGKQPILLALANGATSPPLCSIIAAYHPPRILVQPTNRSGTERRPWPNSSSEHRGVPRRGVLQP